MANSFSRIVLFGLLNAGLATAAAIPVDQPFRESCDKLPHPVSQLVVPGGVTCVTHAIDGKVHVSNSRNASAGVMELAMELCKEFPGVDLPLLEYGCLNNQ